MCTVPGNGHEQPKPMLTILLIFSTYLLSSPPDNQGDTMTHMWPLRHKDRSDDNFRKGFCNTAFWLADGTVSSPHLEYEHNIQGCDSYLVTMT